MSSEKIFFATIRRALGHSPETPRARSLFPGLFQSHWQKSSASSTEPRGRDELQVLRAAFISEGDTLGLHSHVVSSPAEAAAIIVELVRNRAPEFSDSKHLMVHDHPDLAALDLWQRFDHEPIKVHTAFPGDPQLRAKTIASFIGITAVDLAIAESATLVQKTGPGRPRSTSLIPSIHIALVRLEQFVATLQEAATQLGNTFWSSSLTLISGPSKTADIEGQLVHGAHGPCELHVIILDNDHELCRPASEENGP